MKRILLVEDVDMNIDLLTQLLEEDYEVAVARDGLVLPGHTRRAASCICGCH